MSKDYFLSEYLSLIRLMKGIHTAKCKNPTTVGFSHLPNLVPVINRRNLPQGGHGVNHVMKPNGASCNLNFQVQLSNFNVGLLLF